MLSKVWDEITYPFPNFNSDIDLNVSEYSAFTIETVKHWSDKVIAYLSSYPGYFREPHRNSMGLPEISKLLEGYDIGFLQLTSVERVESYTGIDQERDCDRPSKLPQGWPRTGRIKISHLNLMYQEATSPTLMDINVTIQNKEKVSVENGEYWKGKFWKTTPDKLCQCLPPGSLYHGGGS